MGEMVALRENGERVSGYLAIPKAGKGLGVMVIQEWWGLVPHIKDVADRFAAAGFVALAPDLYHGATTTEPDEAMKLAMKLQEDVAVADMNAAVKYLLSRAEVTSQSLGVVGFCMGGALSIILASRNDKIGAAVSFYGNPLGFEEEPGEISNHFSAINGPVHGHWGTKDESTPKAAVEELEHQLRAAGKTTEFFWYDGCDHAFFNDARPEVYDAGAAQLAWDRVTALFRTTIGSEVAV